MYRTVFWTVGEGEGGMIWENGIETCISYMKRVTSPGSMHDTGCLGRVHWDDLEGWEEEGGGRGVQDGEHDGCHINNSRRRSLYLAGKKIA